MYLVWEIDSWYRLRFVMYLVWETDSWYRTEVCDVLSGMVDEADQKTFILTSRPDQPRLLSPVSSPSSYPGFFLTVSHQLLSRFLPHSLSPALSPFLLPNPFSQSLTSLFHLPPSSSPSSSPRSFLSVSSR